jgi:hypothetical protein
MIAVAGTPRPAAGLRNAEQCHGTARSAAETDNGGLTAHVGRAPGALPAAQIENRGSSSRAIRQAGPASSNTMGVSSAFS